MYKVVFMGTPDFSVPILQALIENDQVDLISVLTQPDRKVGRKQKVTPPPVKAFALKNKLKVLQPEKITGSKEESDLLSQEIDLIVTAAYGQFVSKKLLAHPKFGAINVHASLLPKYRGAAPIHYALINGEDKTGVTIMYMDERMDAGDMIAKKELAIEENHTTGILFEELSYLGRDLLVEILPKLFKDEIKPTVQDETQVTYAPLIGPDLEEINWENDAQDIFNLVRGLNPFPGAFTHLGGKRFKIWEAQVSDKGSFKDPGTIVELGKKELLVACGGESVLSLLNVQPFGKGKMPIASYLAGNPLKEGDTFGQEN